MKDLIISLCITTLPVIIAGVLNMIVVKQKWFQENTTPIDLWQRLSDGRRVFGENKTYQGFISMVLISSILQIMWGLGIKRYWVGLEVFNDFYQVFPNTIQNNLWIGALLGFTYMICELPNSFLKRRFGINSGAKGKGLTGLLFFILDYVDSIIGIAIVIKILCDIDLGKVMWYIILGGFTHLAVNIILYTLKIKKEI